MAEIAEDLIQKIIKLGQSDVKSECKKSVKLCKKIFPDYDCIDESVFPKLIPTFVKWLSSESKKISSEACIFIASVTTSSDENGTEIENTKKLIKAGAIPNLIELLSSTDDELVQASLACLYNISSDFSQEVVKCDVLPPAVKCLQAKNEKVAFEAVCLFHMISNNYEPNIPRIIQAGAVEHLIKLLEPNNPEISAESYCALFNIISGNAKSCQEVLQRGALKMIKKIFNLKSTPAKSVATKFIQKVASYGNDQINMVIDEGFIPLIVELIKNGRRAAELKIKAISIIRYIIEDKESFVQTLIDEYNIISVLSKNLQSRNSELLSATLYALFAIFNIPDCKEIGLQKFKESDGPTKIKNLLEHENDAITELAKKITAVVENEVEHGQDASTVESEIGDFDDIIDDCPSLEPTTNEEVVVVCSEQPRKRPATPLQSEEPETNIKRLRTSNVDAITASSSTSQIRHQPKASHNIQKPVASNTVAWNTNAFNYYDPPTFYLKQCCDSLGLTFDRNLYRHLPAKIEFTHISLYSKPATFLLPIKDKSGFGCLSLFLTGTEENGPTIKGRINTCYWNTIWGKRQTAVDQEKIAKVISSPFLTPEHLEIFAECFKCRFMVYCNGKWEGYGTWYSGAEYIPLFIMEKKQMNDGVVYQIVLSLD